MKLSCRELRVKVPSTLFLQDRRGRRGTALRDGHLSTILEVGLQPMSKHGGADSAPATTAGAAQGPGLDSLGGTHVLTLPGRPPHAPRLSRQAQCPGLKCAALRRGVWVDARWACFFSVNWGQKSPLSPTTGQRGKQEPG